mmetsp:Transcript_134861/g.419019  ORF Transcript_134861/g.419019 Transcript_134861/m.419019 type:complete len:462 (+) Transcript_134861:1-1386(+)
MGHLLRRGGYAEQLSEGERQRLRALQARCRAACGPERRSSSTAAQRHWWLRCEHVSDSGQPLPFFVNAWTSEVHWEAPPGAQIIAVPELAPAPTSVRTMDEELDGEATLVPLSLEMERRKKVARRRPGSKYDQASMPWKYFTQITLCTIGLWAMSLLYCFKDRKYLLAPRSPSVAPSSAQLVQLEWPHEFFSPVALACRGDRLFLGDRFEIYAGELPPLPSRAEVWPLRLEPVLLSEDLPGPWLAFDVLCGGGAGPGACASLLLLAVDGRTLWQLPLPQVRGRRPAAAVSPRRWPLGLSLEAGLLAFAALEGPAATGHCSRDGGASGRGGPAWAVLGATERGEVVVLCPRNGQLQPARRIGLGPQATSAEELLAVHADGQGALWRLARGGRGEASGGGGGAALRSSAAADGSPPQTHLLPPGRAWARGLCGLEPGGFVLAAEADRPELWHVRLSEDGTLTE